MQTVQPGVGMRTVAAAGLAMVLVAGACSASSDEFAEDAEDGFVVEDGKADDFYSLKAREFVVTGTGRVVVREGASEA